MSRCNRAACILNFLFCIPNFQCKYRPHAGAELDLLIVRGRKRLAFEIKRTAVPKVTPSMRHALKDLQLERLDVIHAGDRTFPLTEQIRAVALADILKELAPL